MGSVLGDIKHNRASRSEGRNLDAWKEDLRPITDRSYFDGDDTVHKIRDRVRSEGSMNEE